MSSEESRKFITYVEYELFCIKNGIKPKDRSEIGPFVDIFVNKEDIPVKYSRFHDEIFDLLSEDGILSLSKIEEYSKKVGCNSQKMVGLLSEVFGDKKITKDEFQKCFSILSINLK